MDRPKYNTKASWILAGLVPLLVLAFTNCNPINFDTSKAPPSNPDGGALGGTPVDPNSPSDPGNRPEDRDNIGGQQPAPGSKNPQIEIIQKACDEKQMAALELQVDYANPRTSDPTKTCAWGENGNLTAVDGNERFSARAEQVKSFSLPAGAMICDMEFSFPNQRMRYDDHIFLMFDETILGASYPVNDGRFPTNDGIMTYSWDKLVNTRWPLGNFAYVYCLGKDEGYSTCSWPETETTGTISMRFNPILFKSLTALNPSRTNHEFRFVTTGDNDPQSDCQHEPFGFTVKVRYVQ